MARRREQRSSAPGSPLAALRRSLRATLGMREVRRTLAVVFAVDVLTSLVVLAYGNTYLIETLHAPPSYPALALTVYGVVKLASAPLGGRLVDRLTGPTAIALVGTCQLGGIALVLATHSAYGYIAAVGLLATGIAVTWILIFRALGAASSVDSRGMATAYLGVTSGGATATGFALGAAIAELHVWWLAFVAGAACAATLLWLLRRAEGVVAHATGGRAAPAPAEGRAPPLRVRLLAGAAFVGHFAVVSGLVVAFWPFVLHRLELTPLRAVLLMMPAALGAVASIVSSGVRSRGGVRLREIAALYVLGAAGLLFTAAGTDALWFAAGMFPVAVALAGAQPLMNASLIDVSRMGGGPGATLGWLLFAEGLGGVAGPALVGLAIELSDERGGLVAIGGAAVAVAALTAAGSRFVRL